MRYSHRHPILQGSLDAYKPELFDRTFTRIVLMNWRDMDPLIDPATHRGLADYLPGDCRYVRNPDVDR